MKLLINAGALVALLLFLVLAPVDCLHWYTLSRVGGLHRGLFAWMATLSALNCLALVRSLASLWRLREQAALKFAAGSLQAAAEAYTRYTIASVALALCFYATAAVWGAACLTGRPAEGLGYAALWAFAAYEIIGVAASFKAGRIKRNMRRRKAVA